MVQVNGASKLAEMIRAALDRGNPSFTVSRPILQDAACELQDVWNALGGSKGGVGVVGLPDGGASFVKGCAHTRELERYTRMGPNKYNVFATCLTCGEITGDFIRVGGETASEREVVRPDHVWLEEPVDPELYGLPPGHDLPGGPEGEAPEYESDPEGDYEARPDKDGDFEGLGGGGGGGGSAKEGSGEPQDAEGEGEGGPGEGGGTEGGEGDPGESEGEEAEGEGQPEQGGEEGGDDEGLAEDEDGNVEVEAEGDEDAEGEPVEGKPDPEESGSKDIDTPKGEQDPAGDEGEAVEPDKDGDIKDPEGEPDPERAGDGDDPSEDEGEEQDEEGEQDSEEEQSPEEEEPYEHENPFIAAFVTTFNRTVGKDAMPKVMQRVSMFGQKSEVA